MTTHTATGVATMVAYGEAAVVTFYSTPQDVILFTGIKPVDFDLEDDLGTDVGHLTADEKLVEMLSGWLVGIKSYIDQNRNRDYAQDVLSGTLTEVPPGIHNIAMRAAANMVAISQLRRETSVQRVDIATRLKSDEVWTQALKDDLALYPAIPRFHIARVRAIDPTGYQDYTERYI